MVFILLPDQLFHDLSLYNNHDIILLSDPLYFSHFHYCQNKLIYHRETIKSFYHYVKQNYKHDIRLIDEKEATYLPKFIKRLNNNLKKDIHLFYPASEFEFDLKNINITFHENPSFLLRRNDIITRDNHDMSGFYIDMRKQFTPWMQNKNSDPIGNKWSFDHESRSGPSDLPIDKLKHIRLYNDKYYYPISYEQAKLALKDFINNKLKYFGTWQDATYISQDFDNPFLFHSGLSSAINIGLLTPQYIIDKIRKSKYGIHIKKYIDQVEPYIRQLIGWREYIRYTYYKNKGYKSLDKHLHIGRKLSNIWWDSSKLSNISLIDNYISTTLKYSYLHHIQRLNLCAIMLQSGVAPIHAYNWFMEMFIDAYPWVMSPNVYGMIYHLKINHNNVHHMMKRYYLFSCNYFKKMTNIKITDDECDMLNALYEYYIYKHKDILKHDYIYAAHISRLSHISDNDIKLAKKTKNILSNK